MTMGTVKRKILAMALGLVFVAWDVCATAPARAATYVVAPAAPGTADTNAGTEDKPVRSASATARTSGKRLD